MCGIVQISGINLTLKVDVNGMLCYCRKFLCLTDVELEKNKKKNAGKYGSYYQKLGRVLCM